MLCSLFWHIPKLNVNLRIAFKVKLFPIELDQPDIYLVDGYSLNSVLIDQTKSN